MELARYDSALLGPDDLVISISNSGSSSRAREVVLLAKDRGALTLGVTGSLSGALARQADLVVHRPVIEDIGLPPHYGRCLLNFAEYMAVLYALYALALAIGVSKGHITAATRAEQLQRIEQAGGRIVGSCVGIRRVARNSDLLGREARFTVVSIHFGIRTD